MLSMICTGFKNLGTKQIIPILTMVMSIAFIWLGWNKYGFWHPSRGPLPGFFPLIIAVIMLAASIMVFVSHSGRKNLIGQ